MKKLKNSITVGIAILLMSACSQPGPTPFKIGKDACDFCKMTIMEKTSGMELITEKGKLFHFDDISCGVKFNKKNPGGANKIFVANKIDGNFILCTKAVYIQSKDIKTPMGSNIAAFNTTQEANAYLEKITGKIITWEEILNLY